MASSGLQGPLYTRRICERVQAYAHTHENKYLKQEGKTENARITF